MKCDRELSGSFTRPSVCSWSLPEIPWKQSHSGDRPFDPSPPSLLAPPSETWESHTFITCHPPPRHWQREEREKESFLPTTPPLLCLTPPSQSPFYRVRRDGKGENGSGSSRLYPSQLLPAVLSSQPSAIFLVSYQLCMWFPFILYRNVVNSLCTILAFYVVLWVAKTTTVLHSSYTPAFCKAALQFLPSRVGVDFSSLESGLVCDLLWPKESGRCSPVSFQA